MKATLMRSRRAHCALLRRTDSDYLAMEALAAQAQAVASGFIEAFLGEVAQGSGGSHRRGLKASSTDAMLQTIMAAVGELQDGQAALQADVTELGAQVQAANAAEASGVLQALISQAQQQILVGQGRIQTLLAGECWAPCYSRGTRDPGLVAAWWSGRDRPAWLLAGQAGMLHAHDLEGPRPTCFSDV